MFLSFYYGPQTSVIYIHRREVTIADIFIDRRVNASMSLIESEMETNYVRSVQTRNCSTGSNNNYRVENVDAHNA